MVPSFTLGFIGATAYVALFFAQASGLHQKSGPHGLLLPLRLCLLALCAYTGSLLLEPFVVSACIAGITAGLCTSLAIGYNGYYKQL